MIGFDSAFAPVNPNAMPGSFYGVYIGGNNAYHIWSVPDLDKTETAFRLFLPIYSGLQLRYNQPVEFTANTGRKHAFDAASCMGKFGFNEKQIVVLDVENGNVTNPYFSDYLSGFVEVSNDIGRPVCLYSDPKTAALYGPDRVDQKWVASYWMEGSQVTLPMAVSVYLNGIGIWQFANNGVLAGTKVDYNWAREDFPFALRYV